MLIKGESQRTRSAEGMTVQKGMENKDAHTDAMEKGEVQENNPCSSLLKRSLGSFLVVLDLDRVRNFQ